MSTTAFYPYASRRCLSDLCKVAIQEILELVDSGGTAGNQILVHKTRVLTKRLRAAWNLVAEFAPPNLVQARKSALRDLSGDLGTTRDKTVLAQLCEQLARHKVGTPESRVAFSLIVNNFNLNDPGFDEPSSAERIREVLAAESAAWDSLDKDHQSEILAQGYEKSQRRAQRFTQKALIEIAPEVWHDWRKALKRLRYQAEFLGALYGLPLPKGESRVRHLGTLLGKWNDFANLRAEVDSLKEQLNSDQRIAAQVIIRTEMERVVCKCRALAHRLDLA